MKSYERQVFQDFEKYANVVETWAIYDSIVISKIQYGSEAQVPGWFTTFALFGQRETHDFFKGRTEGTAGPQYCNLESSDTMDFAFKAHSFGIEITGPPTFECDNSEGDVSFPDAIVPQWFTADLPRHMGVSFKVQQDVRIELPSMAAPAGYGAVGGGVSWGEPPAIGAFGDIPTLTNATVQGVPLLRNRYPLPHPIGIPRTATIQGTLHVSQWARDILTGIDGPREMVLNSSTGDPTYPFFYTRYVIRMSLFGERLVQQRGQYHR